MCCGNHLNLFRLLLMTAKTGGKYPCLSDENCPIYAACYSDQCFCMNGLSGDGENCEAGENNLIFYMHVIILNYCTQFCD